MEVKTCALSLSNFLCFTASSVSSDISYRQQEQMVDPKGPTPSPQMFMEGLSIATLPGVA